VAERALDRLDTVREDVDEEEEQDAGGDRAQPGAQSEPRALQPAERQAEEDGRAGQGAEGEDLRSGNGQALLRNAVRDALQTGRL
jgi:hypothetical protein